MMLVGPMKRKMVGLSIGIVVGMLVIFGIIGYFVITNYNAKIAALAEKSAVVERYIFTKDLTQNHIIDIGDIELASVKAESIPNDTYIAGDENTIYGKMLRVNVNKNTVANSNLFFDEETAPSNDLRLKEFNMIVLPSDLIENDYIDIRIQLPGGEDFIVLAGKKIDKYVSNTIFLKLTEAENITIGSAIIDSYLIEGSKLYATKYVDPASQLYDYEIVDYVQKYDTAIETIKKELIEQNTLTIQNELLAGNNLLTEDELKAETEKRLAALPEPVIEDKAIAEETGLLEYTISEIKEAKKAKNTTKLESYKNTKVRIDTKIHATYPVNLAVLNVVKNNPNIVEEIKQEYDTIQAYGIDLLDYKRLESPAQKIATEIQTQKSERQNYIQSLIMAE